MSQNERAQWIVAYDMACPRRWAKVFKCLKKAGIPIQYSVFSVEASAIEMEKLIQQLTALIDPKADDVRAYRLPKNGWRFSIGKSLLPEGVWIP